MSSKGKHKDYIQHKLHNLLEDLVASILIDKPVPPEHFILDWLNKKCGNVLSEGEREELRQLRVEAERLKNGKMSDTDTEDSEGDEIDELPEVIISAKSKKARASVSAEAFGAWNKKSAFNPRVIPKNSQQKARIAERLGKAFMFAALDDNEREIVINAMEEKRFNIGDQVITQGEDGDELFVVDTGKLECTKVFVSGEPPKFLKNYHSGEAFGELALLYNVPRAASIKALTECTCWVLDRATFNHIVKDSAARKRESYDNFLSSVELLENIDPYERSQIADALMPATFKEDEYVIREGEWGDVFYMIESGTAIATKTLTPGLPPQEVKSYRAGDYFGELSLLKGEPRAANIIATSKLMCVTLGRKAFKRMLGPLEEILRRNASKYEGILNI